MQRRQVREHAPIARISDGRIHAATRCQAVVTRHPMHGVWRCGQVDPPRFQERVVLPIPGPHVRLAV
jgi:hypothetical protein